MALMLGLLTVACFCLDTTYDMPVADKAELYLRTYVMINSTLAAGLVMSCPSPAHRQRQLDVPPVDEMEAATMDSRASDTGRSTIYDSYEYMGPNLGDRFSDTGSVVFKNMKGPSSQCSSGSSGTASTISLSPGERAVRMPLALKVAQLYTAAQAQ